MGIVVVLPMANLTQILGIGQIAVDRDDHTIGMWYITVQSVGHCPVEKILVPDQETNL